MLQIFENLVAQPLYFELRKDGIFAKGLRSGKTYEGELYVWKYEDPDKGDTIVSVGSKFDSRYPNPDHIPENQTLKQKVFYRKENLVIDDFEIVQTALSHIVQTHLNDGNFAIVRPVVIINVPEEASPVELRTIEDSVEVIGGRFAFIISESSRPMDHQLKNPEKMTFKTLRRPETYVSDRNIEIIIFLCLVVAVIFIVAKLNIL